MTHGERLQGLYPFSDRTLAQGDETMGRIGTYQSFQDVLQKSGVYWAQKQVYYPGHLPTRILDRRPDNENGVVALHQGLNNPFDPNNLYQMAVLGLALPEKRLVASANPGGTGYYEGRLQLNQAVRAARGKAGAFVASLATYLGEQNDVPQIDQFAYSFGNEKMLALANRMKGLVGHNVAVEPVSTRKWNLASLGAAAKLTVERLDEYVGVNELDTFEQARELGAKPLAENLGLLRPTNIAGSLLMARGEFETKTEKLLEAYPGMTQTLVFAGASEYDPNGERQPMAERLEAAYPDRVATMWMPEQGHMIDNDLAWKIATAIETLAA